MNRPNQEDYKFLIEHIDEHTDLVRYDWEGYATEMEDYCDELETQIKELNDKVHQKGIKFLPCTCGRNSHSHYYKDGTITLVCKGCGKSATGKSERDAVIHWNEQIKKELK